MTDERLRNEMFITTQGRRLPPPLNWILPSCELLRGVRWFETDVSGLSFGPIFKGQASLWPAWLLKMGPINSPETSVLNRLTPRNNPLEGRIQFISAAAQTHGTCRERKYSRNHFQHFPRIASSRTYTCVNRLLSFPASKEESFWTPFVTCNKAVNVISNSDKKCTYFAATRGKKSSVVSRLLTVYRLELQTCLDSVMCWKLNVSS
jgi:hypothetical protein